MYKSKNIVKTITRRKNEKNIITSNMLYVIVSWMWYEYTKI